MDKRYQGVIVDRMDDQEIVGTTNYYPTPCAAQHAVERLCKRKGLYRSERYALRVMCNGERV